MTEVSREKSRLELCYSCSCYSEMLESEAEIEEGEGEGGFWQVYDVV